MEVVIKLIKRFKQSLKIFLITVLIILGFAYVYVTDSTIIFKDSMKGIVELKCFTEGYGENYGTAVFIDEDGLLVTNTHIVSYMNQGEIILYEQCQIRFVTEDIYRSVRVVDYDVELDIALLQFEGKDIQYEKIQVANSDCIDYGDKVYSIGNALNHGISITEGVISIPRINIESDNVLRDVIQCDLSISHGNSGGALLDKYGHLIGITSFRTREDNGSITYHTAYSIPINQVIEYVEKYKGGEI